VQHELPLTLAPTSNEYLVLVCVGSSFACLSLSPCRVGGPTDRTSQDKTRRVETGLCLLLFVQTASANGLGWKFRIGLDFSDRGMRFEFVAYSFVIGSFVAKNLEILLTYKCVRVCLVSNICVCLSLSLSLFLCRDSKYCHLRVWVFENWTLSAVLPTVTQSKTLSANVHLCKCLSGSVTSPIVKCQWPFITHTHTHTHIFTSGNKCLSSIIKYVRVLEKQIH